MRKFYSRAAIVVVSAYLFFGAGSVGNQGDFRVRQNLEQLPKDQQIDSLRREQEQNQLQQQLNDIPHQPGEPVERQQQLNNLQQQLDQRQLAQQQNQLREQHQPHQFREDA